MVPNHARYQLRYTRMCNKSYYKDFSARCQEREPEFFKIFAAKVYPTSYASYLKAEKAMQCRPSPLPFTPCV